MWSDGTRKLARSGQTELLDAWYALYTKHQHERSAADFLQKKGFQVFLPLFVTERRWKDRTKCVSLPIFPCYLFLRTSLDRKLEVLRTPGVFWLVESAGRACPVPESEIAEVRRIVQSRVRVEPHFYLTCGTQVRVRRGALTGLTGILVNVKSKNRVVVSLELLKKSIALEIDQSDLEFASSLDGTVPPAPMTIEQVA